MSLPLRSLLLLLAACLAAAVLGGVRVSGATFIDGSTDAVSVGAAHDWTPPKVALASPGSPVRGTVALIASATDDRGAVRSVVLQHAPAGSSTWATVCTVTARPYSCSWATAALPDGPRDLRAVATDDSGYTATSAPVSTLVDNHAPTGVSLSVPGSPVSGSVPLAASATDAHSGVARIVVDSRVRGAGPWTECGTATSSPYTCSFDSTGVGNGTYEFRTTATDGAGNQATSPTVTRTVDNPVSTVTITSPAQDATVGGSVTVTVSASSNRGVTSVRIETRASGQGAWDALCTDTAAPWSCTWDTTATPPGPRDLRAVLLDGAGGTTTSATRAVTVANPAPSAADVQAVNGGVSGRPDAGDRLVLTYSTRIAPATVKAGWNGSATAISVTFLDALATGSTHATRDNAGFAGTHLGTVSFAQGYLAARATATFTGSTMVTGTTTLNGTQVTVVTVTLGSTTGTVSTVSTAGAMTWTPSAAVRGLDGQATGTAVRTETGSSDKDL